MKIVHVSHFSMRKNGSNYYGIQDKLSSGLTRLGHYVFNFSDRDVAATNPLRIRELGEGLANRKLMAVCCEVRPELLLLGHCSIITGKTIRAIREAIPGLRIAHWNCDGLFVPENLARLRALAPIADATFCTTAGDDLLQVAGAGGRVTFMPNPLDLSIETLRVFAANDVPNNLVFLTGYNKYDTEKRETCDYIKARLPDLKFDIRGLYGEDRVFGAALFDVLGQAKMGLSVSKRNDVYLYSSDRMSQLMGCGLLTFIDRRTRFDEIFGPDELVTYASNEELVDRIDYFRQHDAERRRVAEKGWRHAHDIFSETNVAQWIVDVAFGNPPSRSYGWPTKIYG